MNPVVSAKCAVIDCKAVRERDDLTAEGVCTRISEAKRAYQEIIACPKLLTLPKSGSSSVRNWKKSATHRKSNQLSETTFLRSANGGRFHFRNTKTRHLNLVIFCVLNLAVN